ncbi:MAG: hypothetical protein Q8K88_00625, partial [Bradyrhizobium sp.]|nr:hypothetical protein [Bradyrhizobium sp.]
MKLVSGILSAAGLALVLTGIPASAQQKQPAPAAAAKQGSPAALAAAKEILALKNASTMYGNAVPSIVQQTKQALLQANLNYQTDLTEVAVVVAQKLAGREKEI